VRCPGSGGPSGAAIGLVLTGGGAFGAWEVGALAALFDAWCETYGEDPPIRVVAGASTGALIAPYALLGRSYLPELEAWYTGVRQRDIAAPRLGALLPFPLFALTTSSVYRVVGRGGDGSSDGLLAGAIRRALPDARLRLLGSAWPDRRLAVTSLDFASGRPHAVTNAPADISSLRTGMLASAMAPLAFPPASLPAASGAADPARRTPHLDGGVYAVAPIADLLELAARAPVVPLTHIVVISAFPEFPAAELDAVQEDVFPDDPSFMAIGDRMNALLSEAAVTKELDLLRAAAALCRAGLTADEIAATTRLALPCRIAPGDAPSTRAARAGSPPALVVLAPAQRLGWRALRFAPAEMAEMVRRGRDEARAALRAGLAAAPAQRRGGER